MASTISPPLPVRSRYYLRLVFAAIALFIFAGVIGYAFIHKNQSVEKISLPTNISPVVTVLPQPTTLLGWNTITSTACFISFEYPSAWIVKGQYEQNDAKENSCHFRIEDRTNEHFGITVESMSEDSVSTLITSKLATGDRIPVQLPGADDAYRIYTSTVLDKELSAPIVTVIIRKGGKTYSFMYDDLSEESKPVHDHIIQSIRLTGKETDYREAFKTYSIVNKTHDQQIQSDLLVLKTAAKQYYTDNRSYPSTIDTFMPVYLKTIPTDPYTQRPYVYETDTTTYFILRATDGAGTPIVIDSRTPMSEK